MRFHHLVSVGLVTGLLGLAVPQEAQAIELASPLRGAGHWGIGFGGGATTSGLSAKWFMSDAFSLQGVLGIWYGNASGFGLNVDFLWEGPTLAQAGDVMELGFDLGLGGILGVGNSVDVGVGAIAGLEFNFLPVPIDLVLEYRPALVFGDFGGDNLSFMFWNFGGHVRIYFM